jgi:hypothetical protein
LECLAAHWSPLAAARTHSCRSRTSLITRENDAHVVVGDGSFAVRSPFPSNSTNLELTTSARVWIRCARTIYSAYGAGFESFTCVSSLARVAKYLSGITRDRHFGLRRVSFVNTAGNGCLYSLHWLRVRYQFSFIIRPPNS